MVESDTAHKILQFQSQASLYNAVCDTLHFNVRIQKPGECSSYNKQSLCETHPSEALYLSTRGNSSTNHRPLAVQQNTTRTALISRSLCIYLTTHTHYLFYSALYIY